MFCSVRPNGRCFADSETEGLNHRKTRKEDDFHESTAGSFNAESITEAIPKFLRSEELTEKLNSLEGSGAELADAMSQTVSDALSAVICAVVGAILMFLIAMLVLTIVYAILKAIRSKFKLLGIADGILGGVLGCMIAALALMLFGSLVKVFFGNSDAYNASKILKFFADATLGDFFGWLNLGNWIDKLNS